METDEMNFKILENARNALKPKGKFILTTLNALFPLFNSIEKFMDEKGYKTKDHYFDLLTLRQTDTTEITDDSGKKKLITGIERYYMPSEITWYLQSLHFKDIGIYGCKMGQFSRHDPLTTGDFEMLVIAEKEN